MKTIKILGLSIFLIFLIPQVFSYFYIYSNENQNINDIIGETYFRDVIQKLVNNNLKK